MFLLRKSAEATRLLKFDEFSESLCSGYVCHVGEHTHTHTFAFVMGSTQVTTEKCQGEQYFGRQSIAISMDKYREKW